MQLNQRALFFLFFFDFAFWRDPLPPSRDFASALSRHAGSTRKRSLKFTVTITANEQLINQRI